jgi:hypothetical protein
MRIWTVHAMPQGAAALPDAPVRLVREGFAWIAFLLPVLWLLWHRLWLATLVYVGLATALAALAPGPVALPAGLALQFLIGVHAQDLRRRALRRRGYATVAVVAERDQDRALARLLAERPDLAAPIARAVFA